MNKKRKCNLCGKNIDDFDFYAGLKISQRVGYGSEHDGKRVNLQLCCSCFDRIADKCVISPFVN